MVNTKEPAEKQSHCSSYFFLCQRICSEFGIKIKLLSCWLYELVHLETSKANICKIYVLVKALSLENTRQERYLCVLSASMFSGLRVAWLVQESLLFLELSDLRRGKATLPASSSTVKRLRF